MYIASIQGTNQAPLGAACFPTPVRGQAMPLLTELANVLAGLGHYKHVAPDGA